METGQGGLLGGVKNLVLMRVRTWSWDLQVIRSPPVFRLLTDFTSSQIDLMHLLRVKGLYMGNLLLLELGLWTCTVIAFSGRLDSKSLSVRSTHSWLRRVLCGMSIPCPFCSCGGRGRLGSRISIDGETTGELAAEKEVVGIVIAEVRFWDTCSMVTDWMLLQSPAPAEAKPVKWESPLVADSKLTLITSPSIYNVWEPSVHWFLALGPWVGE
jgi:hypothetical protein